MKKLANYKFTILTGCLIIVALLLPSRAFDDVPRFFGIDKLAHLALFFLFSLSYLLEYRSEHDSLPKFSLGIAFILLFIVLSETLQLLTSTRHFEFQDMLFDLAGSASALLVILLIPSRKK